MDRLQGALRLDLEHHLSFDEEVQPVRAVDTVAVIDQRQPNFPPEAEPTPALMAVQDFESRLVAYWSLVHTALRRTPI